MHNEISYTMYLQYSYTKTLWSVGVLSLFSFLPLQYYEHPNSNKGTTYQTDYIIITAQIQCK